MKSKLLAVLLMVTTISNAQVTSGLIAEFNFNNSTHSESGTSQFTGSPAFFVEDRVGNPSSALNKPQGAYFSAGIDLPVGAASRSISIWIKPTTVNSDNVIFSYGSPAGTQAYGASFSGTSMYNFTYSTNLPYATTTVAHEWKHLVVTFENETKDAKMYVNGVLAASGNFPDWSTAIGPTFYLGTLFGGNSSSFNGVLDDLKIYNRAITDSEVALLYGSCNMQAEVTVEGDNLVVSSPSGATIQWLDCLDNYAPIEGANMIFLAQPNVGYYAARVSLNGCEVMTDCLYYCVATGEVTVSGTTLTAVQSNGTYYWIDCNLDDHVTGENQQTFSPEVSGSYGLEVHLDGCSASSECIDVCLINNVLNVSGTTLSVAETNGASYQWMDCSTNTPIEGATTSSFTATETGSYSVLITDNACSAATDCFAFEFINLSTEDISLHVIDLYPNPANNQVQLTGLEVGSGIQIMSLNGTMLSSTTANKPNMTLDVSSLASGIYFVQVKHNAEIKATKKLVVDN